LLLSQQYGARVGPLASKGIGLLGWELDALAAWRTCKGFKWFETVADDDIILAGGRVGDGLGGEAAGLDVRNSQILPEREVLERGALNGKSGYVMVLNKHRVKCLTTW